MADESGELLRAHIVIDGNASGANKVIDGVKKDAKAAVPEVQAACDKIKSALKSVNDVAGRGSGLGLLAKTLSGAGAVMAIALIAREIEKVTAKAEELVDEFRQGKIAGMEIARGLIESLPIIGDLTRSLYHIRELITGEKAAQHELNDVIERGNDLYDQRKQLAEQSKAGVDKAADRMDEAASHKTIATTAPGVERQVEQKRASFNQERTRLLQESSPEAGQKRLQDADDELTNKENAALNGAKSDEETNQIKAHFETKKKMARQSIGLYNRELKTLNERTVELQADATEAEIKELRSGNQEILKIREAAAAKLSETIPAKLEDFRAAKQAEGFSGQPLDNLVQAKREELHADAMKGSRDALRSLNDEFRDSSATTYAEKVKANAEHLQQLASRGQIATEDIDELQAAFVKLQGVPIDNKLKDVAIQLEEVGKTDIEKQVDELKRMGATAEQAALYAERLKAALTGQHVADIRFQTSEVGKNPLEKARLEAEHSGEDGKQVEAAQAKLLGAELTEEVKTPFQKFGDTIGYYKQLLAQGAINQKTFLSLQSKAFGEVVDSLKVQDVHSSVVEGIQQQFGGFAVGLGAALDNKQQQATQDTAATPPPATDESAFFQDQKQNVPTPKGQQQTMASKLNPNGKTLSPADKINKQEDAKNDTVDKKGSDTTTGDNTKATKELTAAVQKLNKRLDKGIVGVLA